MSLNPLGSFYQASDSSIDEIRQKKPKESWSLQTPDLIKTGTQHTGGNVIERAEDTLLFHESAEDTL